MSNAFMPTLRRILKYTPAVVLGLLVVAWVVSWFGVGSIRWPLAGYDFAFISGYGSIHLHSIPSGVSPSFSPSCHFQGYKSSDIKFAAIFGSCGVRVQNFGGVDIVRLAFPYLGLLTGAMPIGAGPFISFRFRLWHYLAYTALVAVELAYYLRWQE
jgi:hypothetical protein